MTLAQSKLQKIRTAREAREKQLRLLAEARASADPRYIQDAITWTWEQVLDRKLRMRDFLKGRQRARVDTLIGLLA